ncbi:hypothetical protein F5I97DRAFT_1882676 [Phlebopus sp. FC_14]|nr:hypothetical protein F5I97DRAFT_1882676 [Phlebopus sp. FC_14]
MTSEKARLAKEKGNTAFKAADYATAVGHYTSAILADSSDPTFHLNRAAAYLQLGKNEDAERDCTNALTLTPKNVKALFRRGHARRALGKFEDARADLQGAFALEPSNSSVKNELAEIDKSIQEQRLKQSKIPSDPHPASVPKAFSALSPKRRRVPIEIIEREIDIAANTLKETKPPREEKDDQLLQSVSSRTLNIGSPSKEEQVMLLPRPQTFADAKRSRESSKPTRVRGGIFRPSGNHTIVTRTPHEPSLRSASVQAIDKQDLPMKHPTTLFQFIKSWDSMSSDDARWGLIRTVPPSSIPALFQASLEPDLLKSILHTFKAVLIRKPETKDAVRRRRNSC